MSNVTDYNSAHEFFQGARNPNAGRPLQNNTRLFQVAIDGDSGKPVYGVRLHGTDVVTYLPNGNVILSSGTWRTVTTKDRITSYAPVRVSSVGGIWEVSPEPDMSDTVNPSWADRPLAADYPLSYEDPQWKIDKQPWEDAHSLYYARLRDRRDQLGTFPFFDGMVITAQGECLNGPNGATWAAYKKHVKATKKAVSLYVKAYLRNVNKTGAAGCFDEDNNAFMDKSAKDLDMSTILGFVQNKSYPISLAVDCLQADGYQALGIHIFLGMDSYGNPNTPWRPIDEARQSQAGSSLYKFLTRKLIPEPPSDDSLSFLQMEIAR